MPFVSSSPSNSVLNTHTAHEPGRSLLKGAQTRAAVVDAALMLASNCGLEGLSIGALAQAAGMSKSGVFAHFGSREELQISVIREYHARFREEIFLPSLKQPRGLPRLVAMFDGWIRRIAVEVDSGCLYISGATDFDDRPGAVRDALVSMVRTWQDALRRAIVQAVEQGHLSPDVDSKQLLFEIHGLVLSLHHDARFLRDPSAFERALCGFERVIRTAVQSPHSGRPFTSTIRR